MNSESDSQKGSNGRSLAKSLGALFALGGGLVLGSASNADAVDANSLSAKKDGAQQLEIRVQKIQKQLGQTSGTEVNQGDVSSKNVQTISWVNWVNWWH
jgi:hypothetical protein